VSSVPPRGARTLPETDARAAAARRVQKAIFVNCRRRDAGRHRCLNWGARCVKVGVVFETLFRYTPRGAGGLDVHFPSHTHATHASEDGTGRSEFSVNNTMMLDVSSSPSQIQPRTCDEGLSTVGCLSYSLAGFGWVGTRLYTSFLVN